MRRILAVSAIVGSALLAPVGIAGERAARDLAGSIASHVDGQTLAVVHLDLAAFDAAATIDLLAKFLHLSPSDRDRAAAISAPINVFSDALPEDAHADVFAVISFSDLSGVPFFIAMPAEKNPASTAIGMELRHAMSGRLRTEVSMEQIGNLLTVASPRTIARLKEAKPTARPEISAAFEAVADGSLQVLLVPTADARRVLQLMLPNLPEQLGGGSTKPLADDIQWLAFGVQLPPAQTQVRLVAQMSSDEAAVAMADAVRMQIASLGEREDVREAIPDLDAFAQRVMPRNEGSRVVVEFTVSGEELVGLGTILAPLLRGAAGTP